MATSNYAQWLLRTNVQNTTLTLQRIWLAAVLFPHGAQKLLGWFGGYGFSATLDFFTSSLGLPYSISVLVILTESLGPLLLVLGLGTRLIALLVSAVMLGAVFTTHLDHGFFMNWFGNQAGEGFEYHLLVMAISVPLAVFGAGRFSLDTRLATRIEVGSSSAKAPQSEAVLA